MSEKTGSRMFRLLFAFAALLVVLLFLSFSAVAETMLDKGMTVNVKMRSLAAGMDIDTAMITTDIKAIHMADMLPDHFVPTEANTVSSADSEFPVYIFFDNENDAGILYFFTEGERITLNRDSSYLLANNGSLTDISGLAKWNSSNAAWLDGAFMYNTSISSLSSLADWDMGNAVSMSEMFLGDVSLSDISALANWNTSNVRDMFGMFADAQSLPDALALRNWDISNVMDTRYMFSGAASLEYIDVSNWNTGKVTSMRSMFQVGDSYAGNGQLREILGIGNWDVSNVTDMTCMFYGAGQMTHYDIADWDVSSVESMNHMFCDNFSLRSLDLSSWDVSSVKTMYCMFDDNYKLKTIGDVSHWNTASLVDAGSWLNGSTSFIGDDTGTLDLSGWNTSNLKAAGEMFRATQLCTIDLTGWSFEAITNDLWEGTGKGIYYETCNIFDSYRGLGEMFKSTSQLKTVYVSQSGLDSYYAAIANGVNTTDMWTGSKINDFTLKTME